MWKFKLIAKHPSTKPFLFLAELSFFSTRTFWKLLLFSLQYIQKTWLLYIKASHDNHVVMEIKVSY